MCIRRACRRVSRAARGIELLHPVTRKTLGPPTGKQRVLEFAPRLFRTSFCESRRGRCVKTNGSVQPRREVWREMFRYKWDTAKSGRGRESLTHPSAEYAQGGTFEEIKNLVVGRDLMTEGAR